MPPRSPRLMFKYPCATTENIVQLAEAVPTLSTLVTALQAGALVDLLSSPGPFTVFAPNNAAFAKIPATILEYLLKPANIKALDRVLELHVVAGKIFARDLTDGEKIKTVNGDVLTVTITAVGEVFVSSVGTKLSLVVAADNVATNGVVHVVDGVLFPSLIPPGPPKTIVDVATADPLLSTLVTALKVGDLVDTLSGAGPFTVFAPTNSAFDELPAGVLANLLKPGNKSQLDDLLTYHVVAGAVFADGLRDGENLTTIEGLQLTVRLGVGVVFINGAKVITPDVNASNGVIHIIDAVLIPKHLPTIAALAAADPDLSTLVTALKAADLVDTLSGPGLFSVFAPTNEAFDKLPDGVLANLLKPENKAQLIDLLTYHVALGRHVFVCNDPKEILDTVAGGTITESCHVPGHSVQRKFFYLATGAKGELRFNQKPVSARNGDVYPIDAVLTPRPPVIPKTIVETAVATADLSTLVVALKAADLVDTLSGPGPFTVFAPTNEAFAALPPGTLTTLLLPQNKAKLVDLLTYHVVKGAVKAKDLSNGERVQTVEGKDVNVTVLDTRIEINEAEVVKADVEASNGVVHLINGVLLPPAVDASTLLK